jgi:uncharacterized membrane protein YidH (DUF202 family)
VTSSDGTPDPEATRRVPRAVRVPWRHLPRSDRPELVFDGGLQQERTALAWERTAIATMVAGTVLARYAATDGAPMVAALGLLQVAFGGGILMWAGDHYDDLHGPLRQGVNPSHPMAARVVGAATTAGTFAALAASVWLVLVR